MTLRGKPCRYCTKFMRGLLGNTWETAKMAHESHNEARRLSWYAGAIFVLLAKLGLRKPPSGNPEGIALLGEGCTFPLPLWSSNRRELGETEERGEEAIGGKGFLAPSHTLHFHPPPPHPRPSKNLRLLYKYYNVDTFFVIAIGPVFTNNTSQLDLSVVY